MRLVALAFSVSCAVGMTAGPDAAQTPEEAAAVAPATASAPPASETPSPPSVGSLFSPVSDFKRLVMRPDFRILATGVIGAITVSPTDAPSARASWTPGMRQALGPGQVVGGFLMQTSAAFATYAVGRATDSRRVAVLGADLVRAQIVTQTTTQLIKFATQRTRPDGTPLSFPSGHSSASFATAAVLQSHFGWKAGVPAYAMAAWVAASRVQRDRHYVSDVVAGATLGILAGKSIAVGRGPTKFSVSPMVAPGGIGVSFTRVQK